MYLRTSFSLHLFQLEVKLMWIAPFALVMVVGMFFASNFCCNKLCSGNHKRSYLVSVFFLLGYFGDLSRNCM